MEWVVNGYEALERATSAQPSAALATTMPEFKLADMKFPDVQIVRSRFHSLPRSTSRRPCSYRATDACAASSGAGRLAAHAWDGTDCC